jgi:spoIIIJ-associated protein
VSQGESAVTEPQVSAADQAPAEQALEEAAVVADIGPDETDVGLDEADVDLDEADVDLDEADVDLDETLDAADGAAGLEAGEAEEAASGVADVSDLELEGEIAADYIEGLLDVADLDGDIDMDVEGDRAVVSVVGATLDELVGSKGEVLEALQELTRLAVHRHTGMRTRIMIDVGGYRMRRRTELAETGRDAADEVKRTGVPKKLWAMNPFERKIVHDAVAAAGLRSESEGEEPDRRVVVLPGN